MPGKIKQTKNTNTDGLMCVSGLNTFNNIYYESNNNNKTNDPIVSPPVQVPLNIPDCLSYSNCSNHAVTIMNNQPSTTIGPYTGNVRSQKDKKKLKKWLKITIKDDEDNIYSPISAVCGDSYTLYLLNPLQEDEAPLLAYLHQNQRNGSPVFLDTEGKFPLALYGGCNIAAAITKEGEILIIDSSVLNTNNLTPKILNLPENENPVYVAFFDKYIFVLTSNGEVYTNYGNQGLLKKVRSLSESRIVHISGIKKHVLAVTEDGQVLGYGSNKCGQLGVGKAIDNSDQFILIEKLKNFEITAAYAGNQHSLFKTSNGAILACGQNLNGELMLQGPTENNIYKPRPTVINEDASFCIAGSGISCVFVSCEPPPYTPNKLMHKYWRNQNTDQVKSLIVLKSQIAKMRNIIESNNDKINTFYQENIAILKQIEGTKQKIIKLQSLKKSNESNINIQQKINKTNKDLDDNPKLKQEQKNTKQKQVINEDEATTNKNIIVKKTFGPLLFKRKTKDNAENDEKATNEENSNFNTTKGKEEYKDIQLSDDNDNVNKDNVENNEFEDNENEPENEEKSDSGDEKEPENNANSDISDDDENEPEPKPNKEKHIKSDNDSYSYDDDDDDF